MFPDPVFCTPEPYCNSHCDPELFGADLEQGSVISNATESLAFGAHFRPQGYGPNAEHSAGERHVIYVFRRRGEDWEFREIPQEHFSMTLQQAVSAESLAQIFR